MARTSGLCGAFTGGVLAVNLLYGRSTPQESRETNYRLVQEWLRLFEDTFGSLNCTELLGCDISTAEGREHFMANDLEIRICAAITEKAAGILAGLLENESTTPKPLKETV